jgi:hypothetical protein
MSSPDNKFIAWTDALQNIIDSKRVEAKELEQNAGWFMSLISYLR